MRNRQSLTLALLVTACAIPDIQVDDSLGVAEGGTTSSDEGGTPSHAGTKNPTGKGGSSTITAAGTSSFGGDDTGLAGEPSVGGSNSMGGAATGGTGGTGGTRPMGGTSGTGGTGVTPAGAVAKFCNGVSIGGEAVKLDLQIGSGTNLVHIVALTGTCQPVVNKACTPISTGAAVPVNVFDVSNPPNQLWTATVKIVAGEAWLFGFLFNEATQLPEFHGEKGTAAQCAAADFSAGAAPAR